jgi:hypothetical protein
LPKELSRKGGVQFVKMDFCNEVLFLIATLQKLVTPQKILDSFARSATKEFKKSVAGNRPS